MLFRREQLTHLHAGTHGFVRPASAIYAMLFAMQCARGMFIVLISWFALQITGEIASVGKVLVCWQLLALMVGPLMGPLIDRFPRRFLFTIGETIHGLGVGLLAVIAFRASPEQTPISVLYGTACLVSLGSLLSYPSCQALLQLVGEHQLIRTVSSGMISIQVGNVVGATLGGVCLGFPGVSPGLAVCAALSFAAAALVNLPQLQENRVHRAFRVCRLPDWRRGVLQIFRNPHLSLACWALLLAYASAHASNAVLAGFVRADLKLSSDLYGWIAAMYSGGGLIGSIVLGRFSDVVSERALIAVGSVLLAAATAAFSTSQSFGEALLWQGFIGLSFMMVRVGSDATVLKHVPNQMIGRVRSNVDAGIGLTAILIYLIPSFAGHGSARHTILGLSGVFAAWSCSILWIQWRAAVAERDSHHGCNAHPALPSPDENS